MKMWKAVIVAAICVLVIAGLAGCTGQSLDGTTTTTQTDAGQNDGSSTEAGPGNNSENAMDIRHQAIEATGDVNQTRFEATLEYQSEFVNNSVDIQGAIDREAELMRVDRTISGKSEQWFTKSDSTYLHTGNEWQGGQPDLLVDGILLDLDHSLLQANNARLVETRTIDDRRVHVLAIEPSADEINMAVSQFGQFSIDGVESATYHQYIDAESSLIVGMRLSATSDDTTVNLTMDYQDVGKDITIPIPDGIEENDAEEPEQASSVVGNITRFNVTMPQFEDRDSRQIRVWTPPGYNESDRHYPVVYMQDGQNLFDNRTAYNDEWGVDETMDRLHREDNHSAIVVGIDNAASHEGRMAEYLPWEHDGLGGDGTQYATWMAETLKPEIDDRYRTKPAESTVAGSSVGSVISLYTAFEYPEQFPYVAGMSTSVWTAPNLTDHINESTGSPRQVYVDWGTAEGPKMTGPNEELVLVLEANDYDHGDNLLVERDEGADHTESAWRERFPRAVQWLLTGEDPDV